METHILWADDEIELLRPHVMFLENKGYRITTVNSGVDAIEEVRKQIFDVIFLDENMPGLTGIQTLEQVKKLQPDVPVIMITKSEEEHIMEDAIGAKIADYLIKPVNPNQILLSLKKNLEKKKLVGERTLTGYQQEFRQIGMRLTELPDWSAWKELYNKLLYWEIELDQADDPSMNEILAMQRTEANEIGRAHV
jgi:DNA-binding NtrC family response regulator